MAHLPPRPDVPVNYPEELSFLAHPASTLLQTTPKVVALASAAVVFDTNDRMLLIQRATHDSQPGTWEAPGGGVDASDPTVLYTAARELWEEAGLIGTDILRVIPVHQHGLLTAQPELAKKAFTTDEELSWSLMDVASLFTNRTQTKILGALSFQFKDVLPDTEVTLDPNEHQNYRWVTESEMLKEVMDDGFEIPLAGRCMKPMLQQAFRLRREAGEMRIASNNKPIDLTSSSDVTNKRQSIFSIFSLTDKPSSSSASSASSSSIPRRFSTLWKRLTTSPQKSPAL